jgi:protein SCO1/2
VNQLTQCLAIFFMGTMMVTASSPGNSLYQLPVTLETADGSTVSLASLRGHPVLISMFYSHCTSVCPMLAQNLEELAAQLSPVERSRIRIVLVSFDAQGDAPADLSAFKAQHHIDGAGWVIARTSAEEVRLLAAALGIRYKQLPDRSFNHSSPITLLDEKGVARARVLDWRATDDSFLSQLKALADARVAAP